MNVPDPDLNNEIDNETYNYGRSATARSNGSEQNTSGTIKPGLQV